MTGSERQETTQLLAAWSEGNQQALDVLIPRLQNELERLAGRLLLNERSGISLQAADLVQEVYLKLVDSQRLNWQHRAHFFAVAATLMRRTLLDRARRRSAAKRGSPDQNVDVENAAAKWSRDLIDLDDALNTLEKVDPRKARIVELRFFAGLDVKETAEIVGVSPDTVLRDWKFARAWLSEQLRRGI